MVGTLSSNQMILEPFKGFASLTKVGISTLASTHSNHANVTASFEALFMIGENHL